MKLRNSKCWIEEEPTTVILKCKWSYGESWRVASCLWAVSILHETLSFKQAPLTLLVFVNHFLILNTEGTMGKRCCKIWTATAKFTKPIL